MSLMLDREITILYYTHEELLKFKIQPPYINTGKNNNPLQLMVAKDGYYDVIYPKSYIKTAGFCQSIIFEVIFYHVI